MVLRKRGDKMQKLEIKDIRPLSEYNAIRKEFRAGIIALKNQRRVLIGNHISVMFENRDTIRSQVQEMMRVEHIDNPAKIQEELDTYNPLIPGPNELSATLFIEITESDRIKETLDQFQELDNGRSVYLELGVDKIYGQFEEGHSKEDKLSAVHYVRFHLNPDQQTALHDPSIPAALIADHPHYQARTLLNMATRQELANDFR